MHWTAYINVHNTEKDLHQYSTGSQQRKSHSSQKRKISHIHGGVGKAVGVHSTFSAIKIHLVKGGPDRSISIDESSYAMNTMNMTYFPLLRAVTFLLFRAGTVGARKKHVIIQKPQDVKNGLQTFFFFTSFSKSEEKSILVGDKGT